MTNEENAIIKGKKWEAIIGLFLLIPPVLGVICYVLCTFGIKSDFSLLYNLRGSTWNGSGDGYTAAVPIFMALMAIAGVLLLKGNLQYLFMKKDKTDKTN